MASSWFVLLSLATIAVASPIRDSGTTTDVVTASDDVPLVEVIEVVETVPVVVPLVDENTTPEPENEEHGHKVAKRSALRGDNPSNDLLAQLDALKYENGLSSLDGRRIKFLPTWLG